MTLPWIKTQFAKERKLLLARESWCQNILITRALLRSSIMVFGRMTCATQVSSDNVNIAAEHQEPAQVLCQLAETSTPGLWGVKVLLLWWPLVSLWHPLVSYVRGIYFHWKIAVSTELLTSDSARTGTSVSLINQDHNTRRSARKAGCWCCACPSNSPVSHDSYCRILPETSQSICHMLTVSLHLSDQTGNTNVLYRFTAT